MYKIPRYINQPLTFLGLELIDVVLIYMAMFYSWVAESFIYFIVTVAMAAWMIHKKRKSPHGYYKHMLYFLCIYRLDHYPGFADQEFLE